MRDFPAPVFRIPGGHDSEVAAAATVEHEGLQPVGRGALAAVGLHAIDAYVAVDTGRGGALVDDLLLAGRTLEALGADAAVAGRTAAALHQQVTLQQCRCGKRGVKRLSHAQRRGENPNVGRSSNLRVARASSFQETGKNRGTRVQMFDGPAH